MENDQQCDHTFSLFIEPAEHILVTKSHTDPNIQTQTNTLPQYNKISPLKRKEQRRKYEN